MIHFAWPLSILFLPLPWLVRRYWPEASQESALFLPFAAGIRLASAKGTFPSRRNLLFLLVWLLLIAAAMRPQWLDEPLPVPVTGRKTMLAVDVSGSMATRDMGASRLDVVKQVAGEFIKNRHGDQVGLILFGTQPYLQSPISLDLNTVSKFLQEAMVGIAGQQTAIGDAIGLALKVMQADRPKSGGEMVLILLTDGGNNAGMMDPITAARIAASSGMRIYTIGVGSEFRQGFFGMSGNADLDENTLKEIARITGGEYFRATDADALDRVYARIDKLEPGSGPDQWYRPHKEWFVWPLALALLLSIPAVAIREAA